MHACVRCTYAPSKPLRTTTEHHKWRQVAHVARARASAYCTSRCSSPEEVKCAFSAAASETPMRELARPQSGARALLWSLGLGCAGETK